MQMRIAARAKARQESFLMREAFPTATSGPPVEVTVMSGNSASVRALTVCRRATSSAFRPDSLPPKGELKRTTPVRPSPVNRKPSSTRLRVEGFNASRRFKTGENNPSGSLLK